MLWETKVFIDIRDCWQEVSFKDKRSDEERPLELLKKDKYKDKPIPSCLRRR